MLEKLSFARWLARQRARADMIGDLSRMAANDARFPWPGGPPEMHDRVRAISGGGSLMLHALGAALDEWHGTPYPLHLERARRDTEILTRSYTRRKAAMEAALERLSLSSFETTDPSRGAGHGAG